MTLNLFLTNCKIQFHVNLNHQIINLVWSLQSNICSNENKYIDRIVFAVSHAAPTDLTSHTQCLFISKHSIRFLVLWKTRRGTLPSPKVSWKAEWKEWKSIPWNYFFLFNQLDDPTDKNTKQNFCFVPQHKLTHCSGVKIPLRNWWELICCIARTYYLLLVLSWWKKTVLSLFENSRTL